jgi:hypothetical protein
MACTVLRLLCGLLASAMPPILESLVLATTLALSAAAQTPAAPPAPAAPSASSGRAPDPTPEVLAARLADKQSGLFLRLCPWHLDVGEARRAAAREGKLILAHFTRSFLPCGTSIRCEREVLSSPEFAALAERVVLWCHVTAHVDPTHDRALYEARGSGWPHHAVLDATGRVLGTHDSYRPKSVAELTQLVDQAQEYLRIEAETELAVAAAHRRRLEAGLAAGALDLAQARALFAACRELPREDAERLRSGITDLEVADVLCRYDRFDESARPAAGTELYEMWRMGKRPSARNAVRDFWGGILLHLERAERPDLELYRQGLAQLDALVGESRGYKTFLDERRQRLRELEERAAANAAEANAAPAERVRQRD